MSQSITAPVTSPSAPASDAVVDLYLEGLEPLLMTADEQQAAQLVQAALAALKHFYGDLDPAQRARLARLYETPALGVDALNAIVQHARAQVGARLAELAGRQIALDEVHIHTARAQAGAVSEPLWNWLARGTPVQLAAPRLTQDANAFVDNSWLTLAGQPLIKPDTRPVTLDDIIALGRTLDIGSSIARQCDDWAAHSQVVAATRREADARLELALLNGVKAGQITSAEYVRLSDAAGLSLPAALSVGVRQQRDETLGHFLLRIEGHALPVLALKVEGQVYVIADTYPEARLFVADSPHDVSAMQRFGTAFRDDLWNSRAQRDGWSWQLLSPTAQQAVIGRLPQPLPSAQRYPATAYWVAGDGAYSSRADYERRATEVRLTAPFPLVRRSVAHAWAQAHVTLLVRRVKERFTPNQDTSLAHAQRIGAEWLTTALDVILIAVPGKVRFPGRALLFKALFTRQLALDLPLSLVQARWEEAGEILVDFLETVVEMQALRKAGTLVRARIDTLSETFLGERPAPAALAQAHLQLRSMMPAPLRGLSDAALLDLLRNAGTDARTLTAMHQGKARMDMALVAAVSETRIRHWVDQTPNLLSSDEYTRLPEAVEWAVVACLSATLNVQITVTDPAGAALRSFDAQAAMASVDLIRLGHWQYVGHKPDAEQVTVDSLFFHAQPGAQSGAVPGDQRARARALRLRIAEQLRSGQGPYLLARALHHGSRPRASVPDGEGRLLAVTVAGTAQLPPGRLQGADARTVSQDCEQRVPAADSLANLAKARYQADLAALAGGHGRAGRQTLTQQAQSLYCAGLMGVLGAHGLGEAVAIRIRAEGRTVSVWGHPDAPQVLLLKRSGQAQAYTYRGELAGRDELAPAPGSDVPLSDLMLRLLDDRSRQALGIELGDAPRLNQVVMQRITSSATPPLAEGDLLGVPLKADAQVMACVQAITLHSEPEANGLVEQQGQHWLPFAAGAIAVQPEGLAWRAQALGTGPGPLLRRQYGEWRRVQPLLLGLQARRQGPVKERALLARLSALYHLDPAARIYHDAVAASTPGAGGASYIALRGQPTAFYRIQPAEPGALEVEVVRPGGTGGGVWLRQGEDGLWQVARTLPGGMDEGNELEPWRPWTRPGRQPVPQALGLIGSTHEQIINVSSGTHKAANKFYPFVRPHRRDTEFKRLLAAAPEAMRAQTDSANIAAKVDLFHHQWALPVDLTALPFFRMPGEVTSELRNVNGALIAYLANARIAGEPVISRIIEPMSGSGLYSNFVRFCGFRGEILLNDRNPLVTLTQREIVRQPDAVRQHIEGIKQDLVEFWQARHTEVFDPQTLRMMFPDTAAATAFVNSTQAKHFREDLRRYFYSTVESQYTLINGDIQISAHSSFLQDPVNGEAQARAFIAAAFYIVQNNSVRNSAPVKINDAGRLDLPVSIIVRDGPRSVNLLPNGLANLGGLPFLSYLHRPERGQTLFSTGDGWHLLQVVDGQSNLGDLAIISGHFSDVYVDEVTFMESVREYVMPFVRNRGRVIITNAYSPYKERVFLELGLRVFVMENFTQGFLLVLSDAVARDVGLANG